MPALYLLARPQFTPEYQRFLVANGVVWKEGEASDAERLVEFAGRVCYMSFGARQSPRDNAAYIANLIDQGHDSVLEHANWTFLLEGVSRSFTHQLVRHRAGFSFSQLSQQYYDQSEAKFLAPTGLEEDPIAYAAWRSAVDASRDAYRTIQSRLQRESSDRKGKERLRAIRSAARSVLPNATETKIVVTANARSLRHFMTLRGAIEGDLEMRQVSGLIYAMLLAEAPSLVGDFENTAGENETSWITWRGGAREERKGQAQP
jgi:thymidylate synthase (FAD)